LWLPFDEFGKDFVFGLDGVLGRLFCVLGHKLLFLELSRPPFFSNAFFVFSTSFFRRSSRLTSRPQFS
jgi:hypothetical protein